MVDYVGVPDWDAAQAKVVTAPIRCFWKIEYYDRATEMGSPDPADPAVTTRVLTITRADK